MPKRKNLMTACQMINGLYQRGALSLELFRKNAVNPHDVKVLRLWGISEVAAMVNRTPQTLRNLEEAGKIPKANLVKRGRREGRAYSLADINKIRDVLNIRPSKPAGADALCIGVCNFKGGVGKSFTSLTIAQALALTGLKVLLIDSDSQGTSTHLGGGYIPDLHINSDKTLLNTLVGNEKSSLKECVMPTHWDGLDLLPANLTLYNAEMLIPRQIYVHRQQTGDMLPFYARLSDSLKTIKNNYDVVIIDTPPSLGFITLNVLYAVDGLIIPLLPSEVDYCSTIQFLNMAQETLSKLPDVHYKFIRLLISRHKPSSLQAKQMEDAIKKVFGENLMTNYMIESEAVAKAAADMKTIFEVEPHANDKKTFKRAIDHATRVSEEIITLLKQVWDTEQKVNLDEVV